MAPDTITLYQPVHQQLYSTCSPTTCISCLIPCLKVPVPLNVFMSKIAVRISNKWKQLAVQVRVSESQIESIDQRYHENPSLMIAIEKCSASGV